VGEHAGVEIASADHVNRPRGDVGRVAGHCIVLPWPKAPAPSAARVGAGGYKHDALNGAQTDTGPRGEAQWAGKRNATSSSERGLWKEN
jgi:hypothetical protein